MRPLLAFLCLALLAACSGQPPTSAPPPATGRAALTSPESPAPFRQTHGQTTQPAPGATAPESPSSIPPLPDLSRRPLLWFAPLPPMPTGPGRPFTGSDDFIDLFSEGSPWPESSRQIQVFKLYGEWVAYHASDAQLRQAVEDIRRRGLALAVEAGPLDPPPECGWGIEGFAGADEGRLIAERIVRAEGRIDLIALDEPYYYGHFYDGPNACRWPVEQVAAEVDEYIQLMRGYFPDLVVGDTEPLPRPITPEDYNAWLQSFRRVNGYDLGFLHLDIDWSRTEWPGLVREIEQFGDRFGVPIGIIYTGNAADPSDETWVSIAGERVKRYELAEGGRPQHVLFQSWQDHPDRVLPESDRFTFTGLVRGYAEDRAGLGFQSGRPGSNLAYMKPVRVSRLISGSEGRLAVDGDAGTLWSSGGFAPQWIEIDLQAPVAISEVRLVPSQHPAGDTTHFLWGMGLDGEMALLHVFQGWTQDGQLLSVAPPEPWEGIRLIRVETVSSPSWVAWFEIEVVGQFTP